MMNNFLMSTILLNQGSVWDGFGYILTIILFSFLYNVTKFFEFKTKYSLCAEVNIFIIFVFVQSTPLLVIIMVTLITSPIIIFITSLIIISISTLIVVIKTDTYQELPTIECFRLWGNGTNGQVLSLSLSNLSISTTTTNNNNTATITTTTIIDHHKHKIQASGNSSVHRSADGPNILDGHPGH